MRDIVRSDTFPVAMLRKLLLRAGHPLPDLFELSATRAVPKTKAQLLKDLSWASSSQAPQTPRTPRAALPRSGAPPPSRAVAVDCRVPSPSPPPPYYPSLPDVLRYASHARGVMWCVGRLLRWVPALVHRVYPGAAKRVADRRYEDRSDAHETLRQLVREVHGLRARIDASPTTGPSSSSPTEGSWRALCRHLSATPMVSVATTFGALVLAVYVVCCMVDARTVEHDPATRVMRMFAALEEASPTDLPVVASETYTDTGACLERVDVSLHAACVRFTTVGTLRHYLLLHRTEWSGRPLLASHLLRHDGHTRSSCGEIARALAHHWHWRNVVGVVHGWTRAAFRAATCKRPHRRGSGSVTRRAWGKRRPERGPY